MKTLNSSFAPVKGRVCITVKDNGEEIAKIKNHNLVVINGRKFITKAIAGFNKVGGNFFYVDQIGIGEGGINAAVDADTTLVNPIYAVINQSTDVEIPDSAPDSVVFTKTISLKDFQGTSTKTVSEAGLFYNEGGTKKLFSRFTFPAINLYYNTEHDISIEVQWTISVPANLN